MTLHSVSVMWAAVAPGLGNHLWQSTLFTCVVGLLTLMLRKNRARLRYWLWLAASVKFLIPFSLLVGMGSHLAWPHAQSESKAGAYLAMGRVSLPFDELLVLKPPIQAPVAMVGEPAVLKNSNRSLTVQLALMGLWLCGSLVVLLRWWRRWQRVSAPVREGTRMSAGREVKMLRRLERIEIGGERRPIEMVEFRESGEPGIFGIARPVLMWPAGISDHLEDGQLSAIFIHELCHIRYRDNLTAAIHMLVESVFWFHPLVWWLGARLVEERERACDEEVVQLGSPPKLYAETILKICRLCIESPLVCAAGISGANLRERIEQIMKNPILCSLGKGKKLLLGGSALFALLAPVAAGMLSAPAIQAHAQSTLSILSGQSLPVATAGLVPSKSMDFDVASIKENRSGSRDMSWGCKGTDGKTLSEVKNYSLNLAGYGDIPLGSCVVRNTPMQWIVGLAYQVPWDKVNQLISGGPSWLSSGLDSPVRFDIDAKVEQPATRAQLFLMLQTLMADRFQLKIHEDYKELPVFELTIAKNGPRLTKAPLDRDCSVVVEPEVPCHNFSGGFGSGLTGRSVSMEDFAVRLSRYTGRPVVDKTGLDGLYDIKTSDFWMPFPDTPDPGKQTIFEMLDQFGIKLKAAKAPVKVLVVDSAQKPSPN